MEGSLVLEDGTVARGPFFGARRRILGELVFNTNMTGYTEALTDPSYRGQILMMTYPLIGNYGVDPDTMESDTIQPTGFVVKEACATPSHPRSAMGLGDFLKRHETPAIEGADTRALIAQVPASAESFAIIPRAAALDTKLHLNPITRGAIAKWSTNHPFPSPWMIGGADLVAGEHPPDHHAGLLRAEAVGRQFHGRRYGGDPIETVEHGEQRKAVESEIGERQIDKRQPPQAVIPEQQPAIVEAVGQPA